jgi:acetaldehyde dehydrogenase (acetylating)
MTLGPGAWGGSSTSDNITPLHLINIKRLGREIRAYRDPLRDAAGSGRGVGAQGSVAKGARSDRPVASRHQPLAGGSTAPGLPPAEIQRVIDEFLRTLPR